MDSPLISVMETHVTVTVELCYGRASHVMAPGLLVYNKLRWTFKLTKTNFTTRGDARYRGWGADIAGPRVIAEGVRYHETLISRETAALSRRLRYRGKEVAL